MLAFVLGSFLLADFVLIIICVRLLHRLSAIERACSVAADSLEIGSDA